MEAQTPIPSQSPTPSEAGLDFSAATVLADYRLAAMSREASLLGRKEVLTGKAKFGIFGDGKETAQLAMAKAFRKGDFRAGYYRDQTLMFALGLLTVEGFFAQLYAHADLEADPASAGRQMNAHFATRSLEADGSWKDLTAQYNSSADLSPTGSQVPRLVGLAYASKLYRGLPDLASFARFSTNGDEIAFGTIGNASCAEGMFWEAINAAGVLQVPLLMSIWDDEYGISVPNRYQITKGNLSELLFGFQRPRDSQEGIDLYRVKGWDYPALCREYLKAAEIVRREHVPAVIHVVEMTQPQGHSTSGSHERYKSKERLAWEEEHCPLQRMARWMIEEELASEKELEEVRGEERERVREAQQRAWAAYRAPIEEETKVVLDFATRLEAQSSQSAEIEKVRRALERKPAAMWRDLASACAGILFAAREDGEDATGVRRELIEWKRKLHRANQERYSSDLLSETAASALAVPEIAPLYGDDSPSLNGFEILNRAFDAALAREPRVIAFGEDLGFLGDVNQGFSGLQKKYGELRVSDTGIRECTILGQAIGMAMRGLRPIAEIQYLDYLLYAMQIMSDDLATLRWRTRGGQKAPVIVRTRGHRLEGVWHSGSPMAGIIHLLRGIHVCVPRDMTRAAGFYNTLLKSDDPALVVEVLNGYRVKEPLPENIGEFTVPLGVPEILREGSDVTVVTYGACCRIVLEAAEILARTGIEIEVIDVQTLLPFDRPGVIAHSLEKTSRIVFVDEDVPGGTTAYMLQLVLEEQKGFFLLDAEPRTLSAKPHRPAYGSDGDYVSKPNREDVFETVYELMHAGDPARYPAFY